MTKIGDEVSHRKAAAACNRETCEGCEIEGRLLCVHTQRDLLDFFVLVVAWAIPFFAGMAVGKPSLG